MISLFEPLSRIPSPHIPFALHDNYPSPHLPLTVPPRSVLKVRASSGASADLTGAFLDRYVFDSGALFLRMGISVEPMKVM
jgi:hypothetical protein